MVQVKMTAQNPVDSKSGWILVTFRLRSVSMNGKMEMVMQPKRSSRDQQQSLAYKVMVALPENKLFEDRNDKLNLITFHYFLTI